MFLSLSCSVCLTRQAPTQCSGDVFEGVMVLQMLAITVPNMMEDAPLRQHIGQDADDVGERNNYGHPHVGPNQA